MTAVEFLVNMLPLIQQEGLRDTIEQAKEMEKQQIMDAHGLIAKLQEDGTHKLISGETYYNETYKKP
jgi:hypothetical protein